MQVQLPKKEIEEIAEHYNCTEEDAYKAYLAAQEKASNIFALTLGDMLDGSKKEPTAQIKLYTPREIKQHLDKYVIGQEEYKKMPPGQNLWVSLRLFKFKKN